MEQTNLVHYKNIISYCIGSNYYQTKNRECFLKSISILDPFVITKITEKLHISALFYEALKKNNLKISSYNIEPVIYYQKKVCLLILRELHKFKKLINKKFQPIILKGPGFWGELYRKNYHRRIEDIDLLIKEKDDIEIICDILAKCNYINNDEDYDKQIKDPKQYELTPFYKKIKLNREFYNYNYLEFYFNNFNPIHLKKDENNNFLFLCRVEIHKNIFMLKNSKKPPEIELNYCTFMNKIKEFKVLKKFVNLPYLSLKFLSDNQQYYTTKTKSPKFIKLLADFIRIISKANNSEITRSINIAKRWGLTKHYIIMLNIARHFTPENTYSHLYEVDYDPINEMLSRLLTINNKIGG